MVEEKVQQTKKQFQYKVNYYTQKLTATRSSFNGLLHTSTSPFNYNDKKIISNNSKEYFFILL
jgi:hypothetical protein